MSGSVGGNPKEDRNLSLDQEAEKMKERKKRDRGPQYPSSPPSPENGSILSTCLEKDRAREDRAREGRIVRRQERGKMERRRKIKRDQPSPREGRL